MGKRKAVPAVETTDTSPIAFARVVTPGLYDYHDDGWYIAFVVAVGELQCMYIRIDYPMVTIKRDKVDFLRRAGDKYALTVDETARGFLRTMPVKMGMVEPKALAILQDLAGYNLI